MTFLRAFGPRLVLAFLVPSAAPLSAQVFQYEVFGKQDSEFFGEALASGVDLDGDGFDDFAVGARYHDSGALVQCGRVEIRSGLDGSLLIEHVGSALGENFGTAVLLVDDLNGDGIGEYCVGAPGASNGAGFVAMYSGADSSLLWIVYGPGSNSWLGTSLALAGDVDGDGRTDVIAGAPGADLAYVFGWNTGAIHTLTGAIDSYFGWSVSGGHDIDGDGVPDVVVGQPLYDSSVPLRLDRGRVSAWSGATGAQIWVAFGDDAGDNFGERVCCLGDVDGNGRAEVAVGAPHDDDLGFESGLVRVLDDTAAKLYDLHGAPDDRLGEGLTALADGTHDGWPDLVIGAGQSVGDGYVAVVNGPTGQVLHVLPAPNPQHFHFGTALASGDLDGDGISDFLVGDPYWKSAASAQQLGAVTAVRMTPAYWAIYGVGWPGTRGIPSLTASNDPALGRSITVSLGNSRGATTRAFLLLGFTEASIPTNAGGTLLLLPAFQFGLLLPAKGLDLTDTLPSDPAMLGVDLFLQALVLDPGASKGLAFTPGLKLHIGYDEP